MTEHRSALIALGVGLAVAGITGVIGYWVAFAVAHPKAALPWTEVAFICIGIGSVGLVLLAGVLEHTRRLHAHQRKLNRDLAKLIRDGVDIVWASNGADGNELVDLTERVDNWGILCQVWLEAEFPDLEPLLFSAVDSDMVMAFPEDLDAAENEGEIRAWVRPCLQRLQEIRMKLPIEPSSPYKGTREREREWRETWLDRPRSRFRPSARASKP